MFDKYQVVKPLGKGQTNSVYLARHTSLDQDRVIKIIPHDQFGSSSEIFEALLLKQFRHPGIPQLYDIYEDESFFYLVEEYISGESLDQFMLHQKIISQDFYINICEELCDIFTYLHSFQPQPVVYRDLKPEHIFICSNHVKLIDFDICLFASDQGNNINYLGNQLYSAPECSYSDTISVKADIYSLGKILYELCGCLRQTISLNVHQIFQKSFNADPDLRFETVKEFLSALKLELKKNDGKRLVKKIAVVGSNHGCGATHIAVALVSCMNYQGYQATYYEKNQSSLIYSSLKYSKKFRKNNEYICCRFFKGIPAYGPGISIVPDSDEISVYDFGTDYLDTDLTDFDLTLFVCGGAIWHRSLVTDNYQNLLNRKIPLSTICNLCDAKTASNLARFLGTEIFSFPFDNDPFGAEPRKCDLFKQLLEKTGGHVLSFGNAKKHIPFLRR